MEKPPKIRFLRERLEYLSENELKREEERLIEFVKILIHRKLDSNKEKIRYTDNKAVSGLSVLTKNI